MRRFVAAALGAWVGFVASAAVAADQPQWGEAWSRNLVSTERNLPDDFAPGEKDARTGTIDLKTARNVKWVARLGSQTYGTPVVAGGKVFVGTNNEAPRDPRFEGDRGVLMCFAEATGEYLWQLNLPKLTRIKWADWHYIGITSPPTVEGKRAYLVSNRGEVLCLDTEGMANGNDGPFTDEGRLMAADDQPPLVPGPRDADIVWRFDMPTQVHAEPHNAASGSVLLLGDYLYVPTANGVEWTHDHVVHPEAPSLIVLDKRTGQLVARDDFQIGPDITHGQWSSATLGVVGGGTQLYFGSGSGRIYAFEPYRPAAGQPQPALLKNLWKFHGHPLAQKQAAVPADHQHDSTSYEVIGNPVFYRDRLYAIFTQEPYHKMKLGWLTCLDPAAGAGDVTRRGLVWGYDALGSSSSTPALADGLIYAPGFDGRLHCLDAATGKPRWVHDAGGPIWASPLLADGKIYFGTGKSIVWILKQGPELSVIRRIRMPDIVRITPTAANGVLYLASYKHLFAIATAPQKQP